MYIVTRLKYLLVEHGEMIALACLLLAVSGGGMAGWFHMNPQTETITNHNNKQSAHLTIGTQAVVANDDGLYAEGTQLTNKSFYPYETVPNITLHIQTVIDGAAGATVTHQVQLVHKVIHDSKSGSEVYWQDTRPIVEATSSSGTEVTSTPTLKMTKLQKQRNQIANKINSSASVTTTLQVETTYQTEKYSGSLTKTVPITFNKNSYSLSQASKGTSHSMTSSEQIVVSRPYWQHAVALTTGGIGLLGFIFAVVGIYLLEPSSKRRYQIQRRRYREWFSTGTVPLDIQLENAIKLDSLEDLVDVAIDQDERIIYDSGMDVYVIVNTKRTHCFSPP